jgi:hypothetical protein
MRIEAGACVIVSLGEPREKFWGLLDEINAAGVSLRGIDLNSFDELLRMLARNETGIYPSTVFFPLRRIERILLDENNGYLPSLQSQFEQRTGRNLADWLSVRSYTSDIIQTGAYTDKEK